MKLPCLTMNDKKYFDLLIKLEADPETAQLRVNEFELKETMDPETKAQKIISYLTEQLAIAEEEKKALEGAALSPLDTEAKQESTVTSRVYYRLKGIVKAVEHIQ